MTDNIFTLASPPGAKKPDNAPGKVSEAEYNAMTAGQKWDYARSFDQSQFRR
jgi:hypothetical protein